jgi:hypothetical protein
MSVSRPLGPTTTKADQTRTQIGEYFYPLLTRVGIALKDVKNVKNLYDLYCLKAVQFRVVRDALFSCRSDCKEWLQSYQLPNDNIDANTHNTVKKSCEDIYKIFKSAVELNDNQLDQFTIQLGFIEENMQTLETHCKYYLRYWKWTVI